MCVPELGPGDQAAEPNDFGLSVVVKAREVLELDHAVAVHATEKTGGTGLIDAAGARGQAAGEQHVSMEDVEDAEGIKTEAQEEKEEEHGDFIWNLKLEEEEQQEAADAPLLVVKQQEARATRKAPQAPIALQVCATQLSSWDAAPSETGDCPNDELPDALRDAGAASSRVEEEGGRHAEEMPESLVACESSDALEYLPAEGLLRGDGQMHDDGSVTHGGRQASTTPPGRLRWCVTCARHCAICSLICVFHLCARSVSLSLARSRSTPTSLCARSLCRSLCARVPPLPRPYSARQSPGVRNSSTGGNSCTGARKAGSAV